MKPSEIADTLTTLFGAASVNAVAPSSWQVETPNFRLLVILSEDESWMRVLLPVASTHEALPFVEQFLEANFDDTQQVRYAFHQNVVWGVYQHNCSTLAVEDFTEAIAQLISLHEIGLDDVFSRLIERRIRQIIQTAKQQGQSLQATMHNLKRLYAEGVLGEIDQSPEVQEEVLAAWRRQLESLWDEVEA
jgi:hypothetical protein